MLEIEPNAASAIANDARSAIAAYNTAIRSSASLTLTCLDADNPTISLREGQRLIEAIADTQRITIDARAKMLAAITLMTSLKRRSDIAPLSVGCPGETPLGRAKFQIAA